MIVKCEIEDGWYKLPKGLPKHYSLGLNDGPPRLVGDRMGFFDKLDVDNIIVDDADDPGYGNMLKAWAAENNKRIDFIERSALIRS
jgi:hypothetical protein